MGTQNGPLPLWPKIVFWGMGSASCVSFRIIKGRRQFWLMSINQYLGGSVALNKESPQPVFIHQFNLPTLMKTPLAPPPEHHLCHRQHQHDHQPVKARSCVPSRDGMGRDGIFKSTRDFQKLNWSDKPFCRQNITLIEKKTSIFNLLKFSNFWNSVTAKCHFDQWNLDAGVSRHFLSSFLLWISKVFPSQKLAQ